MSGGLVSRRVVAWTTGVFFLVFGASVAVGFLGSGRGFGWELAAVFGTALGTTLLAVATGLLALLTWRDVSAAQELAQLTRDEAASTAESLRIAREQAETARLGVERAHRPVIVPASGVGEVSFRNGRVRVGRR